MFLTGSRLMPLSTLRMVESWHSFKTPYHFLGYFGRNVYLSALVCFFVVQYEKNVSSQLGLQAKVERVLGLAFPCNQMGDYPNYHQRALIHQLTLQKSTAKYQAEFLGSR